jgi:hypothetical protein
VTAAPSSSGNNGKGKKNKNNSGAAKAAVPKKSITPHPAKPWRQETAATGGHRRKERVILFQLCLIIVPYNWRVKRNVT